MENSVQAECVSYFKNAPGFNRTMQALWDKWRSYGRLAGEIWLQDPSPEEVQALEGYFGMPVLKKGKLRFQAREFEKALENTKFKGVEIKTVLEEYFGKPLLSKKEEEAEIQEKRDLFFGRAVERMQALVTDCTDGNQQPDADERGISEETDEDPKLLPPALRWLWALSPQKLWQLRQNTGEDAACLERICQIGKAFCILEQTEQTQGIRLAVLAMECTGDPHGFDRGTAAGNLLLGALPVLMPDQGEDGRETRVELSPRLAAEDALERYIECGIRPDDLSSFTILYRILLEDVHGPVKAYQAMADRREPVLVSLLNLRNIRSAVPLCRKVYVLENQMVFSQLCEECPDACLICTSGQVRTASLMVLDLLCRQDIEIYYSGDLDPEGILIADRLISRSRGKIQPWHMNAADYENCMSTVSLTDERIRELDHVQSQELQEAAEAVRKQKKAGYQEKLLRMMADEIQNRSQE